jgi:hypothetical protein
MKVYISENNIMSTPTHPCKDAVLAELIAVGATPDNPVDLYLIGPTVVATG